MIRFSALIASIACMLALGTAAAAPPRGGKVIARIAIPENSGALAAGAGAIWTTSDVTSTLLRIDPRRNAIVTRSKIPSKNQCPQLPGSCGEATVASGSLWIARVVDNDVLRIDPGTSSVTATIPVGGQPEGIAATAGAVWVVNRRGPTVSRIDPTTNRVVATIRIAPHTACCPDHMAIAAAAGTVWASVPTLNAIVRISPATNAVVARVRLSGSPCAFIAADARAVWAAGGHCVPTVMRVDARTNKRRAGIEGFVAAPLGLAVAYGSLWVVDLGAKIVFRVDPSTGRIVGRLPVGGDPVRIAVGFGSVWVRDDTGRMLRINPRA